MRKIIFGMDTGSIEEFDQCVAAYIRDDMDAEEMEQAMREDPLQFEMQTIVVWDDIVDSLTLAARAEGVDAPTLSRIVATVHDSIDNND